MVTRREVAQLAGVSPTTVSRIINENGYVSEEVRIRVLKAIDELGYVPNRVARSLRTQKSKQIACITYGLTNTFYAEIVQGIEEKALESGYTFSIYSSHIDKQQFNQLILGGFYDGLIILTPSEFLESVEFQKIKSFIPISVYWDLGVEIDVPHIKIDLKTAMEKMINNLVDNGHSRIVYLGSTEDGPGIKEDQRLRGYMKAIKQRGISLSDDYLLNVPSWEDTAAQGYMKVKELIKKQLPFTAIAACNDLMAIGAIKALIESGFQVPKDISVTGFDNINIASMLTPALTTISFPKKEIGRSLMKLLLRQINGEEFAGEVIGYTADIIHRETVRNILVG